MSISTRLRFFSSLLVFALLLFLAAGTAQGQCRLAFEERLASSDGNPWHGFGLAVSVRSGELIVGSPGDDLGGTDRGAATVYAWNGVRWVERQRLQANDGTPGDAFGSTVFMAEGLAVVGAPMDDGGGPASGAAYIYHFPASSVPLEQRLYPLASLPGDEFGCAVATTSQWAVVGARMDEY